MEDQKKEDQKKEDQKEDQNKQEDQKKDTSILPLIYTHPIEETIMWVCDKDQNGKVTSVFVGRGERYCAYLPDEEEAKKQENLLINDGWIKRRKPEITISFAKKKKKGNNLK